MNFRTVEQVGEFIKVLCLGLGVTQWSVESSCRSCIKAGVRDKRLFSGIVGPLRFDVIRARTLNLITSSSTLELR